VAISTAEDLTSIFVIRFFAFLFIVLIGCSPKVATPDPEALKPAWLKTEPYSPGYYTGIGHSRKDGSNNYVQFAKKSALDDLASQIKVVVSSTSLLSSFESGKEFTEKYQQIIQTQALEEIEDFELVDAYEDPANYWVYYRLSISKYKQKKEEQRRNATMLATDYFTKGREADKAGERSGALSFYFQAFRALEKHLDEPIKATIEGREVLLSNEIYASIQGILEKIQLRASPAELVVNRRIQQTVQSILVLASFRDLNRPAIDLPLNAVFVKGAGDIFPTYKTNQNGEARILLNKIGSRDLEQSLAVKLDIDALSASGNSKVYALIAKTLNVPVVQVALKVQRPLVYLTAEERNLGSSKSNTQISNKLKNLLANNGFEFTSEKTMADLWFDVRADSEKGSVTGSIYVTYLTGVIRVSTVKEGKEIYQTTLDRIKGFGLDYDKSSIDAYNKALDTLEKDKINELISMVLQ
jgi:phage anti-repressor protein